MAHDQFVSCCGKVQPSVRQFACMPMNGGHDFMEWEGYIYIKVFVSLEYLESVQHQSSQVYINNILRPHGLIHNKYQY
jgi:hypothetical protein